MIYAVIENAGYEGEREVKRSQSLNACIGWMAKRYSETKRNTLHVDIARVLEDGSHSYEW